MPALFQRPTFRRPKYLSAMAVTGLLGATFVGLATQADAQTSHHNQLAPHTHFTMAADGSSGAKVSGEAIPNIDSVKSTIRTYYNASADGVANKTSSPYISQLHNIEDGQVKYLKTAYKNAKAAGRKPAIVFDADDTTLWTYDMEDGAMHFNYDPALQDKWVQGRKFPAVPGMVDFVNKAHAMGFKIFGLTGRDDKQKTATLGNLKDTGYKPFKSGNFFTKWDDASDQPSYVKCQTSKCTTVEYKANTRKHIEKDLGYDVVLNVGDQYSDLQGGYADRTLKLPNPTYYLPSPDLPGVNEPKLQPRTHFTMKPDGSSGKTEGGEGIPNIDSVKSTIRTYYKAPEGIADKKSSPYISQLASIQHKYRQRLINACRAGATHSYKPAVVFDTDETTLWGYDMEDGAMHFNYDPALQDKWVQGEKFDAVPGMVDLVDAVGAAGCKVIGITGRSNSQHHATVANLDKVGYAAFTSKNFYTKFNKGQAPASYFDGTPCEDGDCTTIEYKTAVRKHVEHRGYTIIANVGDQYSDLIGGHSGKTIKLPNPTYYLP